jgi:lactoylglutathione lyase
VQDKVWVADPAGNRWEVYTVLEDVEHDDDHQGEPSAAACCSGTTACCT